MLLSLGHEGSLLDTFSTVLPLTLACQESAVTSYREKDGLWAVLAWLSILAHANGCVTTKSGNPLGKLIRVRQHVIRQHALCRVPEPPQSQGSMVPAAGSDWQDVLCQADVALADECGWWSMFSLAQHASCSME